jgi:beta-glucuronidase
MHAEAPVRGGRANTDEDVATIFSYLKDLNANFVRLAHYPHDERMERAADRGRHHDLVGDTKLATHLL